MDNLTHSLVGAVLGQAGLKRLSGLGLPTLIIAANIPDIDASCTVYGIESLAMRRGLTHGPIAMLVLPLLLTVAIVAWDRWQAKRGTRPVDRPEVRPFPLFLLALIGTLSHPAFDWLNTYGIRMLEPFSHQWFYGDSIFIVDLWLWLGMGLAVWLSRRREKLGQGQGTWQWPAQTAMTAVALYLTFNIGLTWHVEAKASKELDGAGVTNALVVASPLPVMFWKRDVFWRDAQAMGGGRYDLFSGLTMSPQRTKLGLDDPRIAKATAAQADAAAFLFWARMPFADAKDGALHISDQRFDNLVTRDRFTVQVD
jgi:inner membrane protein